MLNALLIATAQPQNAANLAQEPFIHAQKAGPLSAVLVNVLVQMQAAIQKAIKKRNTGLARVQEQLRLVICAH